MFYHISDSHVCIEREITYLDLLRKHYVGKYANATLSHILRKTRDHKLGEDMRIWLSFTISEKKSFPRASRLEPRCRRIAPACSPDWATHREPIGLARCTLLGRLGHVALLFSDIISSTKAYGGTIYCLYHTLNQHVALSLQNRTTKKNSH